MFQKLKNCFVKLGLTCIIFAMGISQASALTVYGNYVDINTGENKSFQVTLEDIENCLDPIDLSFNLEGASPYQLRINSDISSRKMLFFILPENLKTVIFDGFDDRESTVINDSTFNNCLFLKNIIFRNSIIDCEKIKKFIHINNLPFKIYKFGNEWRIERIY